MAFAFFLEMGILGMTFALPAQAQADAAPTFQITTAPSPIVLLNYFTISIQQTGGIPEQGQGYLICYDPGNAPYLQTRHFTFSNGNGSIQAFANTDLSYQETNFTIDCNLYYSANGNMIGYPGNSYFTIRQLQIGDSFYKGGQNGSHLTTCANYNTVPYSSPCPAIPTPTSAPATPTVFSTSAPTSTHTPPTQSMPSTGNHSNNTVPWLPTLLIAKIFLFMVLSGMVFAEARFLLHKRAKKPSTKN